MKRINKSRVIAAAGAAVFSGMSLFNATAQGASFTWNGLTDANLSGTTTNWTPNGAPGGADVTVFALSTQLAPQVNANVGWLSMTFNSDAPAYTFGGAGSILLGNTTPAGGAIVNNSAATQTFNVPMAFRIGALNAAAGNLTFTNTFNIGNNPNNNAGRNVTVDGAFTTTISGQITGTTGASTAAPAEGTNWGQLIKNGSGTLILSNDTSNLTYTGRITVNNGALQVQAANALGAYGSVVVGANTITAGTTHVGGGVNTGRLELVNNLTYAAETLSLEARSVTDTQLSNLNGNNTWTGAVSLLTGGGTYTISSESGLLTIAGNVTNNTASTAARTMVLRGASNGVISGNIVEAGVSANLGISKEGAGTWKLTGANTYSGSTNISGGTLSIGDGGATGSLGAGNVTNDANLVFNRNAPATVANAISGSGNVIQAGSSTTALSGALSYTGSTVVQSGGLAVSTSKTGGGAVSVADGAALTLNSASTTTTMAASTFTVGSAVGGAALNFSLGTAGNPTVPLVSATSLVRNGTNTVNLSGSNLSTGTITLIQYGSQSGGGTFTMGSLPARVLASLFNTGTKLDLNITGIDFPKWTGALNNTWDATVNGNPKNWKLNSNNVATDYLQGDSVLFDNSTSVNTVNITATVSPNAITVDNNSTHNYTFGGAGAITGLASLTKTGNGALTIANDGLNDFSGPISIGAGGTLSIGAGTISGSIGAGAITNNGNIVLNRSDGGTLGNIITGGSGNLVAQGGSTWILASNNAYSGQTFINSGTLQAGTGGATGSVGTGNVEMLNNSTFSINRSGTVTLNQQINGDGNLSKNGASTLILGGNNSFNGAVSLNLGVIRATSSNAFGTGAKMIVVDTRTKGIELDAGVALPSSVTLRLSGDGDTAQGATVNSALHSLVGTNVVNGNIQLGVGGGQPFIRVDANGLLRLNGDISVVPGASTNGRTLTFTGAGGGEVNGVISDGSAAPGDFLGVSLNGTGAPSWLLTRDNTFSSSISIQSGTLSAGANTAFGTNAGTFAFIGNGGAGFAGIPAAVNIAVNGVNVGNQLWTNKDGAGLGANQNRTIGYSVGGGTGTFSGTVDLNGGVVLRSATGGSLVMSGVIRNGTDASAGVSRDVFVNAGGNVVLSNANTYTGATQVDAGQLVIANTGALSAGTLTVNPGAKATLQTALPGAVKLSSLAVNGTGAVDMNDNDMIVSAATPSATIYGYIQSGYNFQGHDGPGIHSSAAASSGGITMLGMLTDTEYAANTGGATTFDGIPVQPGDTLIKYTYYGDVDFNGQVDTTDYNIIDFGFLVGLSGWANGDVDYNGQVDTTDYNLIDFAFLVQSGSLRRAMQYLDGSDSSLDGMDSDALQQVVKHDGMFGPEYATGMFALVPEPATGATMLVLATAGLAKRRRRSAVKSV